MESGAVLALAFLALIISCNAVDQGRKVSREEDEELERQLNILNKPGIKTITTENGDIYDCVDIYKQPAFDHPLLKKHKLQMSPSFMPNEEKQINLSMVQAATIGLPDGGCPQGFVPIKRTQKDDLVRTKNFHNISLLTHIADQNYAGYAASLNWRGKDKLYGTSCHLNAWGLSVDQKQYSAASAWVKHGCEGIVAGWMVSPTIFGDGQTRTFVGWTADCGRSTGCFNTLCPGFVHVHSDLTIGFVVQPLSIYNGRQYEIPVTIFKDMVNGNWWLVINGGNNVLGYWPGELFTKLSSYSDGMMWGGYAYSPKDEAGPSMGSGFPSHLGYGKAAFVRRIQVMDNYRALSDPKHEDISYGSNNPCYDAEAEFLGDVWRWSLYYGGPGCLRNPKNHSESLIAL